MKQTPLIISFLVITSFLSMIYVNYLANALPINNLNTGQVSDSYPNLFAPAGVTFSIWGIIYLLLGGYSVYQLKEMGGSKKKFLTKLNKWFILSSLINLSWIFAWHYLFIELTVLLMLGLLYSLLRISMLLIKQKMSQAEKLIIKLPFSIYLGWINIATIANITAWLVSTGWNGFGLSDVFWTVTVLIACVLICSWRMFRDANIVYGLVAVWAYLGIYIKHTAATGFSWQYPEIIYAVLVCIAFLIMVKCYLVWKKRYW